MTPSDLLSYAFSLSWQGLSQDPTGLILMGARYYDPNSRWFLSPDPVSHPLCLDLYSYANSDPINFRDPDGRFASEVYQTGKSILIGSIRDLPPYKQIEQVRYVNKIFQSLQVRAFNHISSALFKSGNFQSFPYQVGSTELFNGAIMNINGIRNSTREARASSSQISQYANGAKVYGVYNATHGLLDDVVECAWGNKGVRTPPAYLLKDEWAHFIANHDTSAKILQICHSGGATQVKNALLSSSEFVRQKIIVLAIAPSVIIPKDLCFNSYNYISRRDFVTHLDVAGKKKYGHEVIVLEPHPDAEWHDHGFLSPTFRDPLERQVLEYIENYGGK
jgi:RHS repeat-associated protein